MAQRQSDKQMLEAFRQKCKKHELSVTPQRVAIYKELIKSHEHPCAEDVFNKVKRIFANISLDTVYRTLTTFVEIGVIDVVEGYGEARRYDPVITTHHHFRCRKCERIIDFNNSKYDTLEVPREFKRGYDVTNVKVVLEGLCNRCS